MKAKNLKQMIEDGFDANGIVSEDGKFFTLIDGELNIDPNQKVFFGDGYFIKDKKTPIIRYYTKGKNLRLYWKKYRENIDPVLNKFVEIVIDAIRDERDMTDLIDIYKRNSKILIDNNHTIFASCLTQYAPEIIGAEKLEIKKRITIGGKQGTLWIYTEYGKNILYLNAYFQYRDSVGMRIQTKIITMSDQNATISTYSCLRQEQALKTRTLTTNPLSILDDAKWIKIGTQYQTYLQNVDLDILDALDDVSELYMVNQGKDYIDGFFLTCSEEFYNKVCGKPCEEL